MAAIITDDFRRNSVEFLINDIKDKQAASSGAGNPTTDDDATKDTAEEFEYFLGIGKSDAWENDSSGRSETDANFSAPIPSGSVEDSQNVLDNIIGAVGVGSTTASEVYYLIPRNNWTSGRRYKRWNIHDPDMFNISVVGGLTYYPCYTINANKIYVCLDNGSLQSGAFNETTNVYTPQSSESVPSGGNAAGSGSGSRFPADRDAKGYIWAYIADLNSTSKFNTDQFVSITQEATIQASGTTAQGASDATTQTGGLIYGFEIVNSGTTATGDNLTGQTELELVGEDSTGGPATVGLIYDTTNGKITNVKFSANSGTHQPSDFPKTYKKASVRIKNGSTVWNAGSEPEIRPLIAPVNGFGHTPTQDLPAFYAGIACDLVGNVASEFATTLSYRQISLLRNPTRDTSATSTSETGTGADDEPTTGDGTYDVREAYDGLKRMKISSSPNLSNVSTGDILVDKTSTVGGTGEPIAARAFIDYVDDTNDYIYFHQNNSTNVNQQEFSTSGSTLVDIFPAAGGSALHTDLSFTAIQSPELTPRTGEVMFIENRKPIQRAAAQTEEIKLVIQF